MESIQKRKRCYVCEEKIKRFIKMKGIQIIAGTLIEIFY